MAWSKIELDNTIDYKQLAKLLLDNYIDFFTNDMAVDMLLSSGYNVNNLIELGFDNETINNVMQMFIDDYNTTK
jgi:hypothetical protein